MLRNSLKITVIFGISTFVQLISNIIVTRIFGATINLDIFLAAVTLPTIILTVIYATLNDVFLPLYGEIRTKDKEQANKYLVNSLIFLIFFSVIISLILFFSANHISYFFYKSRGEEFVKNVAFQLSIMTWSLTPSIIATLFGAYFYFDKQYNRFPFAQLMGSMFNLLFIIFFYKTLGIWSLVISFILNIIFQIFFVCRPLKMFLNFKFPNIQYLISSISPLLFSWLPLIVGNFALRSDVLLIRSFGSQLPTGYLVYLNLITKIFSLATGITTIGIQIVLLPHLIEEIANKNFKSVTHKINKAKIGALIISFLIGLIIIIFSPPIIKLLFVGGKFTVDNYQLAISLLPYFFLASIGWGVINIFFQPLIALKKTWVVGLINLSSLMTAWSITYILNILFNPLTAISWGVTSLLFINILLAEIFWQYYKRNLHT